VEKEKQNRVYQTILTLVLASLIAFYFTTNTIWFYLAFSIGSLSLISSCVAEKIYFGWMQLSLVISKIMPTILLSVIYYLFLVPIALLSRVFGEKDNLLLKNKSDSLFVNS
jgi:hypothetical protein